MEREQRAARHRRRGLAPFRCVKALRHLGYTKLRQRGSHVRMTCPGRAPVTVPLHATLPRRGAVELQRLERSRPVPFAG